MEICRIKIECVDVPKLQKEHKIVKLYDVVMSWYRWLFSTGGDSKTLMIVQVAPVEKNVGETICSLNFAQRVRSVELGQASKKIESGDVEVWLRIRLTLF